MIHNNYQDRQRIRNEMIYKACMPYRDFTPVLLIYWTKESLYQFLIPCSPEQLQRLSVLSNVDENGTSDWEKHREAFEYLKNKISLNYEDSDGEEHSEGEWMERYFIDTHDENGKPLPMAILPPGTALIITGMVL